MSDVSISEAADALGVTENAIRKRIRRGSIPARKEGERWIVSLDDAAVPEAGARPGLEAPVAGYVRHVERLEHEVEFLQGQIEAKDRLIELLLEQSRGGSQELSGHLRHAIDALVRAIDRPTGC